MYSKKEASEIRQQFWTAFGQYMQPVLNAEGEKAAWINYKTGEKDIYFRMQAEVKAATIAIELAHKDSGLQQLYFEQFLQFKALLHTELGEEWTWESGITDDYGRMISRIGTRLTGVSVYKREDWPKLISFFKPRIIALDAFWSQVKYGFEALR
ncbi:MAG: hypothetical protein JWP88_1615 [Flaviaesturariibacter sp.]|nr:hypothetical protein [Flaviaesturariibacter sp.]